MTSPRILLASLLTLLAVPTLAGVAAPAEPSPPAKEPQQGPVKPATPPETDFRRRGPAPAPVAAPPAVSVLPQAAKKKAAGPQKSGDDDDTSDLDIERRAARKAVKPAPTKEFAPVRREPAPGQPPPPQDAKFRAGKAMKDHVNAAPTPPPPPPSGTPAQK